MKKAIICSKHSYSSIKSIVASLENVSLFRSINNRIRPIPEGLYDILIRWGGTSTAVPLSTNAIIYNKREGIKNASNKFKARKLLLEHNVDTPDTWMKYEKPKTFPCIGRFKNHYGGSHYYFCNDFEDYIKAIQDGCYYFSEYFEKDKEFRVHTFLGRCLILQKKIVPEGTDPSLPWNFDSGNIEKFNAIRWGDYCNYLNIINTAIEATEVLGLDFAAVDIMSKDDEVSVLEVNTAPKLDSYPVERYTEGFKYLFASSERREWFEEDLNGGNRLRHRELQI
ncbi:MAG: hypothetical protein ACOCRK_07250 [bacterium]